MHIAGKITVRVFVLLVFAGVVFLNLLSSGIGPEDVIEKVFHNHTMWSATVKYGYELIPPGWTFRIWELIYAGLGIWLLAAVFLSKKPNTIAICDSAVLALLPNMVFNLAFIFTFNYEYRLYSLLSVMALAASDWIMCAHIAGKAKYDDENKNYGKIDIFAYNFLVAYATWSSFTFIMLLCMTLCTINDFLLENQWALHLLQTFLVGVFAVVLIIGKYNRFHFCYNFASHFVFVWALFGNMATIYKMPDSMPKYVVMAAHAFLIFVVMLLAVVQFKRAYDETKTSQQQTELPVYYEEPTPNESLKRTNSQDSLISH